MFPQLRPFELPRGSYCDTAVVKCIRRPWVSLVTSESGTPSRLRLFGESAEGHDAGGQIPSGSACGCKRMELRYMGLGISLFWDRRRLVKTLGAGAGRGCQWVVSERRFRWPPRDWVAVWAAGPPKELSTDAAGDPKKNESSSSSEDGVDVPGEGRVGNERGLGAEMGVDTRTFSEALLSERREYMVST